MRFQKLTKDKPERVILQVKNAESSSAIPLGTPVVLNLNGTNDGLEVVLPASAAAQVNSAVFGVSTEEIAAGKYGEVQCFGFCRQVVMRRLTRAASTDSWASTASQAVGVLFDVDTVNNAVSVGAASVGATDFLPWGILAESLPAIASSASATSDTRTAITTYVKAFLRMM